MRPSLILVLLSCASPEGLDPAVDERPVRTQSVSVEATSTPGPPPDLGLEMAPGPEVLGTRSLPAAVVEAEDGYGELIPAPRPLALEIEAHRWPGRALDPVLHLDDRHFHHYTHPGPGLIRFVMADADWLEKAQDLAIQYGDDTASRVTLPRPPETEP